MNLFEKKIEYWSDRARDAMFQNYRDEAAICMNKANELSGRKLALQIKLEVLKAHARTATEVQALIDQVAEKNEFKIKSNNL
jgi:hypothetical protein